MPHGEGEVAHRLKILAPFASLQFQSHGQQTSENTGRVAGYGFPPSTQNVKPGSHAVMVEIMSRDETVVL